MILRELVGENNFSQFMQDHLFKTPYSAPSTAGRFENLFNWATLDEILQTPHDDCWLPKFGQLPEDKFLNRGRFNGVQARLSFLKGRTVLIRHSEKAHAKLSALARQFENFFESPTDIQLYATPTGEEGFDWHYDVEDVFIIQTQGEKEFRLRQNSVTERPLPMMNSANCKFQLETTPEIRCWLKAGDFLYIPAGFWHKAQALTDSFHISIGVLSQPCQSNSPNDVRGRGY